jgi:hypothetical protein
LPACIRPRSLPATEACARGWTDATAWWTVALGEHHLWTGDRRLVRDLYPRVRQALRALDGCRTEGGLTAPCNGGATYAALDDTPSTYLNVLHERALRTAVTLARVARRPREAGRWLVRARALRVAINRALWDPGAGAYRHSLGRPGDHSQDGNALAALWGVAGPVRARRALRAIGPLWHERGAGSGMTGEHFGHPLAGFVTNWISYFELRARLRAGGGPGIWPLVDRAWGWMHLRWRPMRSPLGATAEPPGAGGLEHVLPTGELYRGAEASVSHVWSEGAALLLTTGLLGVEPAAPGFRRWVVRPRLGGSGVRWARGRVPTPHGPLDVAWDGARLRVRAPRGTCGTVHLGGRRRRACGPVTVRLARRPATRGARRSASSRRSPRPR